MADEARALRPAPGRHAERHQRVLQDLQVAAGGFVPQGRVLAEGVRVDDAAGGAGDEVEQPREAADVADERLGLHFFPQVGVGVGAQVGRPRRRVALGVDAGKRAVRERTVQLEVGADLAGEQRVQVVDVDPSREQIRLTAPELASARPGEQESEARRASIEEHLHGVEQRRHALHLVDEHRCGGRRRGQELVLEPFRMADEVAERAGTRQIEAEVGLQRGEQCGLADLARAEQEDAPRRRV